MPTIPHLSDKTGPVGGNNKILFQIPVHAMSSWAGDTACTTLVSAMFPSYPNLARVVSLGLYLGQAGAGDTNRFLANDATMVWKVLDSCTSDPVAVVRLNVPKTSGTRLQQVVARGKHQAKMFA
jgi:hypothetical protein